MGKYLSTQITDIYNQESGFKLYKVDSSKYPTDGGAIPCTTTNHKCTLATGYYSGSSAIYALKWSDYRPTAGTTADYDIYSNDDSNNCIYTNIDNDIATTLSNNGLTNFTIYYKAGTEYQDCGADSIDGYSQFANTGTITNSTNAFDAGDMSTKYTFKYYIDGLGYSLASTTGVTPCPGSTNVNSCCSSSQLGCGCDSIHIDACPSTIQKQNTCSSTSTKYVLDKPQSDE